MFSLANRTALITGASGGIGSEIARTLAKAGARVALSGTRVEKLEEVAKSIATSTIIVAANLADPEDCANLVKRVEAELGGVDILVNNAGITKDNLLMRMSDEQWSDVIDINLSSNFRVSKTVLRGMMKRRHGRIINIASVIAQTGNAGQSNYAASKGGLIALTKSLAQEVASRGVTVNAIAPGFIATAMTDKLADDVIADITSRIPLARTGTSSDIAHACLYLASDEASYVTGETLSVNGGMHMA